MRPESDEQSNDQHEDDAERSRRDRDQDKRAPEDRPGEPGAEGGSQSPTRDKLPGAPSKDDPSPVGDTDQHSTS
ncbi:MAG TPA: hypothetical protein VGG07_03230 [Solirubrobacteraceae bacterium]|jgi:hypothetical protein